MATGDYIHFLDDDDLLHPEFCEKTVERLTSGNFDGVVTDCRLFHKFLPDYNLTAPLQLQFHKHLLEKDMELYVLTEPVAINSVMMRSSIIKQFRFNDQVSVGEDTLFFLEMTRKNNNWAGVNQPLAFVRRHRSNTCRSSGYAMELKTVLHQLLRHSRSGEKNVAVTIHLQLLKNDFLSHWKIPVKSLIHILISPLQTSLTTKRFLEREVALWCYRTTQRFKG
jgi:glycosyltransferase involved in cell wall biosynthesis